MLKSSTGYPILVELKNGETYNGHLSNIDQWMNVNLSDVIRTSKDGDHFWSVPEMYIRGNTIKYLRVPDAVLDAVADEKHAREATVRLHPFPHPPPTHPPYVLPIISSHGIVPTFAFARLRAQRNRNRSGRGRGRGRAGGRQRGGGGGRSGRGGHGR